MSVSPLRLRFLLVLAGLGAAAALVTVLLPKIELLQEERAERLRAVQVAPQLHFYDLDRAVEEAACSHSEPQVRDAVPSALQLLSLAPRFRFDTEYGDAVHYANLLLGRDALLRGDTAAARQYLIAAGRTPGSPQLAMYGPDMTLAKELLQLGESEVVLEYLGLCGRFWLNKERNRLAEWTQLVNAGQLPDFGQNADCSTYSERGRR